MMLGSIGFNLEIIFLDPGSQKILLSGGQRKDLSNNAQWKLLRWVSSFIQTVGACAT